MKNEKILPISYPLVDSYPATSDAMSILQAYLKNNEWFYNNFIQLYEVQNGAIDFFDFSIENNPFLIYSEIDYSLISKISSLKKFIKDAINEEYYIRLFINAKYCDLYKFINFDFYHDIMIYGYSDEILFVADHFKNGKFSFEKISIDDLIKAYDIQNISEDDWSELRHVKLIQMIKIELDLYRLQMDFIKNSEHEKDSIFGMNYARIKTSFEDYLNSKPTMGWYTRIKGINKVICQNHDWGINCYKIIKSHILSLQSDDIDPFSLQSFYVEYLHKKMAINRIEILEKRGILRNSNMYQDNFKKLCNDINMLLLSFIKEKTKKLPTRDISTLLAKTDYIICQEEELFNKLICDFVI